MIRFKKKSTIVEIVLTTLSGMVSIGVMLYGISHFGLRESWPELILNLLYINCVVMIWMFFFNHLTPKKFNYCCSVCVGITVLLRDILFAPHLAYYPLHLACLTLSVALLMLLTYFFARKDWETYTKRNLWTIYVIDTLIAVLYNIDIVLEPCNEYTAYMLTEIWIRPLITYGLVACFVKERQKENEINQSK